MVYLQFFYQKLPYLGFLWFEPPLYKPDIYFHVSRFGCTRSRKKYRNILKIPSPLENTLKE